MVVLRIEHPEDGDGPWSGKNGLGGLDMGAMPGPERDGIRDFSSQHIFAFPSSKVMFEWMSEEDEKRLRERGFVVKVLEIEEEKVLMGKNQVAFPKGAEKVKEIIPLMKLRELRGNDTNRPPTEEFGVVTTRYGVLDVATTG